MSNNKHPETSDTEFVTVSTRRLAILSILTVNIYPCYLHYKNWKVLGKVEGRTYSAFARALCTPFFSNTLMERSLRAATDAGYKGSYSVQDQTVLYFCLCVSLLPAFPALLPMQEAMRFYNRQHNPGYNDRRTYTVGEVASIILSVVYIALIVTATAFAISSAWKLL